MFKYISWGVPFGKTHLQTSPPVPQGKKEVKLFTDYSISAANIINHFLSSIETTTAKDTCPLVFLYFEWVSFKHQNSKTSKLCSISYPTALSDAVLTITTCDHWVLEMWAVHPGFFKVILINWRWNSFRWLITCHTGQWSFWSWPGNNFGFPKFMKSCCFPLLSLCSIHKNTATSKGTQSGIHGCTGPNQSGSLCNRAKDKDWFPLLPQLTQLRVGG